MIGAENKESDPLSRPPSPPTAISTPTETDDGQNPEPARSADRVGEPRPSFLLFPDGVARGMHKIGSDPCNKTGSDPCCFWLRQVAGGFGGGQLETPLVGFQGMLRHLVHEASLSPLHDYEPALSCQAPDALDAVSSLSR